MIKGKTKDGFAFKLDDDAMNDIEFVELLAEANTSVLVIPAVAKWCLGEEGYAALKEHLRDDKGRVRPEDVSNAMEEIFEIAEESKKSQPSPE